MILAYITIINQIWLELIIDPSSYNEGMFHFGSMVSKGARKSKGKWAIGGIWNFYVKNVVGQLGQMKSMILGKKNIPVCSYDREPAKENLENIQKHSMIGRLSEVVASGLYMLGERQIEWSSFNNCKNASQNSSHSNQKLLVAPASGFGSNLTKENINLIAFGYKLHSMSMQSQDDKARMLNRFSLYNNSKQDESQGSSIHNFYQDVGQKVKLIQDTPTNPQHIMIVDSREYGQLKQESSIRNEDQPTNQIQKGNT